MTEDCYGKRKRTIDLISLCCRKWSLGDWNTCSGVYSKVVCVCVRANKYESNNIFRLSIKFIACVIWYPASSISVVGEAVVFLSTLLVSQIFPKGFYDHLIHFLTCIMKAMETSRMKEAANQTWIQLNVISLIFVVPIISGVR